MSNRTEAGAGCLVILLFLALAFAVDAVIALGAQWVVESFAGHPVGSFWAYFVAVVILTALIKSARSSSK